MGQEREQTKGTRLRQTGKIFTDDKASRRDWAPLEQHINYNMGRKGDSFPLGEAVSLSPTSRRYELRRCFKLSLSAEKDKRSHVHVQVMLIRIAG